jgi:hypothetical protein
LYYNRIQNDSLMREPSVTFAYDSKELLKSIVSQMTDEGDGDGTLMLADDYISQNSYDKSLKDSCSTKPSPPMRLMSRLEKVSHS